MSAMKKWEHLQIPFENVKEATKDFEKLIGKGGYGEVYEGQLLINGMLTKVAVKRLNERSWQGLKEFLTEIDLLSCQQHQNIITLVGYCDQGTEKIIVYEYAEHGSLDQYIRSSDTNHALTWLERLEIVIGVARGLDHLHNHLQNKQLIIHRDIKCSNILLDHNWEAKISDLGLSKSTFSGLERSTVISHACGTMGYLEPEYVRTGFVSKKTDVYSFGMVLFEVLCGRLCTIRDIDGILLLTEVAREYYENNKLDMLIDPVLREQMNQNSLSKFSAIAYKCLQARENRPLMDVVLKELEETLEIQIQDKDLSSSFKAITRSITSLQKASIVLEEEFKELLTFCSKPVEPDWLFDGLSVSFGSSTAPEEHVYHPPILVPFKVTSLLHDLAQQILQTGQPEQILSIYREARSSCMEASLKALGVETLDVQNMQLEVLKAKTVKWIGSMRIAVKMLFVAERKVSDQVFEGMESFLDRCFADATGSSVSLLLSFGESLASLQRNFGEAIAISKRSPEHILALLDMYAIMKEVQPEFNTLYASISAAELRESFSASTKWLAKMVEEVVVDFEEALEKDDTGTVVDGSVHPLTTYVVNFLLDYKSSLKQLSVEKDVDAQPTKITARIMLVLHEKLELIRNMYDDEALGHLFMMNNMHYIVTSLERYEEMKDMLGDEWIQSHLNLVLHHAIQYKRISLSKVLQCLAYHHPNTSIAKERLKTFNFEFEKLHRRQSRWTVPDSELRALLRLSVSQLLLPAYRAYIGHYSHRIYMSKYIKFMPVDVERLLEEIFGRKKDQNSIRH